MDTVSFSVLVGMFPFLFFFLWLGLQFLSPQNETPSMPPRIALLVLTVTIVLGVGLLLIGLFSQPEPPAMADAEPAQIPERVQPEN